MTELKPTKEIPDSGKTNSSDWQMNKINMGEKCSFLFLNPIMADVEFVVGLKDAKTIPAHKFVLSVGSPVFYTMFSGEFIESTTQMMKIKIPDVEPEVFESLLEYLYLDRVSFHEEKVVPLLYCSKKYMIPLLTKECISYLCRIVKASNVILYMHKTRIYDCPEFWNKCWDVITRDPNSSFESESFVKIDFTTLLDVMSKKILNRSEIAVFKASLKWATARIEEDKINKQNGIEEEENMEALGMMKKKILGNALNHVCFDKMSSQEISDYVVPSGVLGAKDVMNVLLRINSVKNSRVENSSSQTYTLYNMNQIISNPVSAYTKSLQFDVNQTVKLTGLSILSAALGAVIKIKVTNSHNGTFIANSTFKCSAARDIKIKVNFLNVMVLSANTQYTIAYSSSTGTFSHYVPVNTKQLYSSIFSVYTNMVDKNIITDIHYCKNTS